MYTHKIGDNLYTDSVYKMTFRATGEYEIPGEYPEETYYLAYEFDGNTFPEGEIFRCHHLDNDEGKLYERVVEHVPKN